MNGRDFIKGFAGSGLALPFAARAQQAEFARKSALYLGIADEESFKRELREAMREHGYVKGRDIAFEFRSAEGKLDRHYVAAELGRPERRCDRSALRKRSCAAMPDFEGCTKHRVTGRTNVVCLSRPLMTRSGPACSGAKFDYQLTSA